MDRGRCNGTCPFGYRVEFAHPDGNLDFAVAADRFACMGDGFFDNPANLDMTILKLLRARRYPRPVPIGFLPIR